MLVHVLVPEMLIRLQAQGRNLGQDLLRDPGLDQERDPGRRTARQRREQELGQLALDSLRRDLGRSQQLGQLRHRCPHLGCRGKAKLGGEPGSAQYPQRIIRE